MHRLSRTWQLSQEAEGLARATTGDPNTPGSVSNQCRQSGHGVARHIDGACRRTQPPPGPESSSPGNFHLPNWDTPKDDFYILESHD